MAAPASTNSSALAQLTQTAIEREHEKVLAEIEGTELTDLIGTSLRAVYELDNELEKKLQNENGITDLESNFGDVANNNNADLQSEFGGISIRSAGQFNAAGHALSQARKNRSPSGKQLTSQQIFNQKLKERIKQLDYDIELMCNHKYQGFIEALNDLSNVSTETNDLFNRVSYANTEVQELGKHIAEKRRDIIHFREQQNNISVICATISSCLPLFHAYERLEQSMQEERYHAALKGVEQIEHVILPLIKSESILKSDNDQQEFSFTAHIEKQVPTIRIRVKEQAGVTFKNFLELISSSAEQIGEVILARNLQLRGFKHSCEGIELPESGAPPPLRVKTLDDYYEELAQQEQDELDGFDDDYQKAVLEDDELDEVEYQNSSPKKGSPVKNSNPFGDSSDDSSDETTARMNNHNHQSNSKSQQSKQKSLDDVLSSSESDSDSDFGDNNSGNGASKTTTGPACNLLKVVSKGKTVLLSKDDTLDESEDEINKKRRLQEISVDELLDFTPIFRTVHIYKLLAETTRKNKINLKVKPKKEEETETTMNLNCSNLSLESCVTIVTEEKRKRLEADPNIDLSMTSETELAVLYRRERRKQARLLLQIMNTRDLKTRFAEHYCRFLQRITGFFTIESHLLSTASYLYKPNKLKYNEDGEPEEDSQVDISWLSDAWSWACSKVIMLLRNQLSYQDKASILLETKDLTMAFVGSAEESGFEIKEIMDALPELWKQYG